MKFREAQAVATAISQWGDGQVVLTRDAADVMNEAGLGWRFDLALDGAGAPVVEDGRIKISVVAANG
jgi:hypothetical protein